MVTVRAPLDRAGRQRIRAPPPASVNQQPDPHVLARFIVETEAPARLDDQRRGVLRLPPDLHDATPQFPRRPQRIGKMQIVVGQQRRGDALGEATQRVPAGMGVHACHRNGRGLDDVAAVISRDFPSIGGKLLPSPTYGTVTYGAVASLAADVTAVRAGTAALGWHTRPGRGPARRRPSTRRPRRRGRPRR